MTHPALDVTHWDDGVPQDTLIADGHVTINVRDGHLVIKDGVPGRPRVRRLTRSQLKVTRVVNLGTGGYITWQAYAWMRSCGVTFACPHEVPAYYDWRAIRGQASGDMEAVQYLIGEKILGQARNLDTLGFYDQAQKVRDKIKMLDDTGKIHSAEIGAAAIYWNAWAKAVTIPWRPSDVRKIPDEWVHFRTRTNVRQNRERFQSNATDPMNAVLNYAYRVAETACREACLVLGLNPALGILHLPRDFRDSFVYDLLEAVRPVVDAKVIRMFQVMRSFDRRWCHETTAGVCRIDPPLTHTISGWQSELFDAAMPVVTETARILRQEGR